MSKVSGIREGAGGTVRISWLRHQDPSLPPITRVTAKSLPLQPDPSFTCPVQTRGRCAKAIGLPGGLRGCSSRLKSWAASRPSLTLHQSALFKHTGRRLSGPKQASVVLPLKPVGDQSTNQYESSFLEEVATPCRGLEVIFCCN